MTAEIAIMNRKGVALAADSAVTSGEQDKVYNTVHKLFKLSDNIGVMIYGNSGLMEVPWETLIKMYKDSLEGETHETIKDYGEGFINFLKTRCEDLFPEEKQKEWVIVRSGLYFKNINNEIESKVTKEIQQSEEEVTEERVKEIVNKVIANHHGRLEKKENMSSDGIDEFIDNYEEQVEKAIKHIFEDLPLSDIDFKNLNDIAAFLFTKKHSFNLKRSGIVIAGFGEEQIFPALIEYVIEGVVNDQLEYFVKTDKEIESQPQAGAIIPFAQTGFAMNFITGIDKSYRSFVIKKINKSIKDLKNFVLDHDTFEDLPEEDINSKVSDLRKKFKKELSKEIREESIDPILKAVSILPKSELSEMAESLVSLTSFRKRISMDQTETVGGPIDVAVISKGDGFIWIKQKSYYDEKLNS